ncbi:MAG TPA: hypothetical protein VEU96_27070 [Bryobacteraceae bacterium]|nr:hypothetical protein [Bryobacteraceae bacterium]
MARRARFTSRPPATTAGLSTGTVVATAGVGPAKTSYRHGSFPSIAGRGVAGAAWEDDGVIRTKRLG